MSRDQETDGLYRVDEAGPCPQDDCEGTVSEIPYAGDLLCDRDADHVFNRGVLN